MSNLVVRTFAPAPGVEFQIRVVVLDGSPWFVAADVCRALGMDTARGSGQWTRGLSDDEKGLTSVHTPGGLQNVTIVSESGLYRLLMRSDKPNARPFQDWVTRDVLPSIRRTGSYVMGEEKLNDPSLTADDLDALNDKLLALHKAKGDLLERRLAEAAARIEAVEAAKAVVEAQNALMAPTVAMVEEHYADGRLVKLTAAARQLDGVNSNRVHRDLTRAGSI